ncbi:class GN sortase [Pleionea mediterranea]|uniref:Sortase A n=1 Tax=Pleionea mediterranea TaxID=523701 RepID=A0A316FSX9_9GAMM|nr:class GN sortase [Pleionea mediterranea]PWK51858.1 sortase A [Pleionea mediterranea]
MKKLITLFFIFLVCVSSYYLLTPIYYKSKATVAQILLNNAWQETRNNAQNHKPWPWADTWPVFKLTLLKNSPSNPHSFLALESFIVLDQASGESLAFAPGWVAGTVTPGDQGNSLIAAHRDTHFSILKTLSINDRLRIENTQGHQIDFVIDSIEVVDATTSMPNLHTTESRISLITCYPFDMSVQDPDYRLVVSAYRVLI